MKKRAKIFESEIFYGVVLTLVVLGLIVGASWFSWWLFDKPADNYRLCGERADALRSQTWTSTGWRKDVCHVWKNHQETVIEL